MVSKYAFAGFVAVHVWCCGARQPEANSSLHWSNPAGPIAGTCPWYWGFHTPAGCCEDFVVFGERVFRHLNSRLSRLCWQGVPGALHTSQVWWLVQSPWGFESCPFTLSPSGFHLTTTRTASSLARPSPGNMQASRSPHRCKMWLLASKTHPDPRDCCARMSSVPPPSRSSLLVLLLIAHQKITYHQASGNKRRTAISKNLILSQGCPGTQGYGRSEEIMLVQTKEYLVATPQISDTSRTKCPD